MKVVVTGIEVAGPFEHPSLALVLPVLDYVEASCPCGPRICPATVFNPVPFSYSPPLSPSSPSLGSPGGRTADDARLA